MLKNETYAGIWYYGKRRHMDGKWTGNGSDHRLAVEVPPIVDRETWEAAQARRAENKVIARRNLQHDYLLGKRVTCGECGGEMYGDSQAWGDTLYQYYRCWSARHWEDSARSCSAPGFRADQVDAAVWEWVKSFLLDPAVLGRGLSEYQAERDRENAPIRERLKVVDDLLADNRAQLERLLDLYLSGEFPKEALTDRKIRLETTISALEKERAGLVAHLEARTLTADQIKISKTLQQR